MTKVSFYQLTVYDLKKALPSLLGKALDLQAKILILSPNQDQLKKLNDELWSGTRVFIPHCLWDDKKLEHHPVVLNYTEENLNNADFVFCVDGFKLENLFGKVKRVFDIFSGQNPQEVEAARDRYRSYKSLSADLEYYQQLSNGQWQKS
jgi:DNA polymerase-3 subunit chi